MKKSKIFALVSALLLTSGVLAGCGGKGGEEEEELTGTALAVSKASKMSLQELEAAAQKEAQDAGDSFKLKVVGLTSVLRSVATTVAENYEWLDYHYDSSTKTSTGNIDVHNGYKDYQLLTALETAETNYFADYALAQDVRSFSTMIEDGITHNYIPSDAKELGLPDEGLLPLYGVHFNKLFWTNTNFEEVTNERLFNIWQVAGKETDEHHLSKVSFQSPTTEQINMSFLLTAYAEENQARILKAYKDFYDKDWVASGTYKNAGEQWVEEFIANISRFHTSDGTAMKKTQLDSDWNAGYVYYGAFAKMKDAAGEKYSVDLDGDGTVEDTIDLTVTAGGVEYKYTSEKDIYAMSTVKWDWEINGFNGFMYCMDSQIINNAKYPYNACLFARTMLLEKTYTDAIYNSKNPDAAGNKANQYGYYYPGQASADFRYAKGDWTKEQHIERELNEKYDYLKGIKISQVNNILALVNSNTKASS